MLPTVFDAENLKIEVDKLKEEALKPEVYTNPGISAKVNKDIKVRENKLEKLTLLETKVKDLSEYIDLLEISLSYCENPSLFI